MMKTPFGKAVGNEIDGQNLTPKAQRRGGCTSDDILRLLVYNPLENKSFVPNGALDELITLDTVALTLASVGLSVEERRYLTGVIVEKGRRIFAILVFINQVSDILPLLLEGFTDEMLPVAYQAEGDSWTVKSYLSNSDNLKQDKIWVFFQQWKKSTIFSFCERQWMFLSPTFRREQFKYLLHRDAILPFVSAKRQTKQSHFSIVFHVEVHAAHLQQFQPTIDRPLQCAIKELSAPDSEDTFEKESNALAYMREKDHQHFIKCIAAVQKDKRYLFIFPWANGGNLREFWASDDSMPPNTQTIFWAISQMRGLADALKELHSFNTRHGDLKPENILHFSDDTNSGFGRLVIADLGLSKIHTSTTRSRHSPTRTVAGTARYEAPEAFSPHQSRSRVYDLWGLGCIFLEFVTWMLHGWTLLQTFSSLFESYARVTESGIPQLNEVVWRWIEYMLRDPRCARNTALGEILDFTKKRLLVPIQDEGSLPPRASARELCDYLDVVRSQCSNNTAYIFDPELWEELGRNDASFFLLCMSAQLFPLQTKSTSAPKLSLQTRWDWRMLLPQFEATVGGIVILTEGLARTQPAFTSEPIDSQNTMQRSTIGFQIQLPVANESQKGPSKDQLQNVVGRNSDMEVSNEGTLATIYSEVSSGDSDWGSSSDFNYDSASFLSEDEIQDNQAFERLVNHTKGNITSQATASYQRALESGLTLVAYQQGETSETGRDNRGGTGPTGDKNTESPTKKKRKGSGEDHKGEGFDEDSGEDDEQKRRGKKKSRTGASRGQQFACPFYKCDPTLYGGNTTCRGHGWDTVHRIKEHLFRTHMQPVGKCPRCLIDFGSVSSLQQHQRQATPCDVVENVLDEAYIDVETAQKLRRKAVNKYSPKKSESVKWMEIFRLLFPKVNPIPSPYFDDDQERWSKLRIIQDFSLFANGELMGDLDVLLRESGIEDALKARIVERFQTSQLKVQEKYLERQQHNISCSEQGINHPMECTISINPEECHHNYCRSESWGRNDTRTGREEDDEGSLSNPHINDSSKGAGHHVGDEGFIRNLDVGTSGLVSEIATLPPSSTSNYTAPAVLQSMETRPLYETRRDDNGIHNLSDSSAISWSTRSSPRFLHRSFGRASNVQSGISWPNSEQQRFSPLQTDLDSQVFLVPGERNSSGAMRSPYTCWQDSNAMHQLRFTGHPVIGEPHSRLRIGHVTNIQEANFSYSQPSHNNNIDFYDSGYLTIMPQLASQADEENPWGRLREGDRMQ